MTEKTDGNIAEDKVVQFAKRFEDKQPTKPIREPKLWWFDWVNSDNQRTYTELKGFVRFNPPYITIIPEDLEQSGINDALFAVGMDKLSGFGQVTQNKTQEA